VKTHSYHHGDLRQALVDEAAAETARAGHRSVTIREVARRVEVSHTAAHYHFPTREALLCAVAERGFGEMTAALEAALAETADPNARFAALGRGYVAWATAHSGIYQLMFSAETADQRDFPSLREAGERMFQLLVDSLAACQRSGDIRPGAPTELALTAWSSAHGIASLLIDNRLTMPSLAGRPPAELMAIALGGMFDGVRAR